MYNWSFSEGGRMEVEKYVKQLWLKCFKCEMYMFIDYEVQQIDVE